MDSGFQTPQVFSASPWNNREGIYQPGLTTATLLHRQMKRVLSASINREEKQNAQTNETTTNRYARPVSRKQAQPFYCSEFIYEQRAPEELLYLLSYTCKNTQVSRCLRLKEGLWMLVASASGFEDVTPVWKQQTEKTKKPHTDPKVMHFLQDTPFKEVIWTSSELQFLSC